MTTDERLAQPLWCAAFVAVFNGYVTAHGEIPDHVTMSAQMRAVDYLYDVVRIVSHTGERPPLKHTSAPLAEGDFVEVDVDSAETIRGYVTDPDVNGGFVEVRFCWSGAKVRRP